MNGDVPPEITADSCGQKLGHAMSLLSQRATLLKGEGSPEVYAQAGEVMADLAANLHLMLPEQRLIASKLIIMGLEGISQVEA